MTPSQYVRQLEQSLGVLKTSGDRLKTEIRRTKNAHQAELKRLSAATDAMLEKLLDANGDPVSDEAQEAIEMLEGLELPDPDELDGLTESLDDNHEVGVRRLKDKLADLKQFWGV